MEHRYDYFHQNPNSLVNGQSTFNRSSADGTQPTNNYSGSISSTYSQDQPPFNEKRNINAVPIMNNHIYQMDSSNQPPPRSSGPPRTNAKGIFDNSSSSIPNVMSLAQSNAENYPNNPDFQLQPHLTGLLPQQSSSSKKVPELYSVDNYSTNRGSIAANMNTNYFSSIKSYPEPKIIEYDLEETSTESSPQHTSSLYSESTDQDSESTHPSNVMLRHTLIKGSECHVTKESKAMTSINQEFPVPTQFADLVLERDDISNDHKHSILHSAYPDDDVIEDIPLSDNLYQDESVPTLDNQEIPESQFSEKSFNNPRTQNCNYFSNKKDSGPTEFSYENKPSSSPVFNNKTSYLPYNVTNSSNIQNPQFNQEPFFRQSNDLTQSSSFNSSILPPPPLQNKPLFPFNNDTETSRFQNYNNGPQSDNYNQQNKQAQSAFQDSNCLPIDSNLICNTTNNITQETNIVNQSTSLAQAFDSQNNCELINSNNIKLYNHQNVQPKQSISHQAIHSSSKPTASELPNSSQSTISQQFTTYHSSLDSTQSVSLSTQATIADPSSRSSSSVSEAIVKEIQNMSNEIADDREAGLPNDIKNSLQDLNKPDLANIVKSEFETELSQSPSNSLFENQQELTVGQSNSSNKQLHESNYQQINAKPLSPPLVNFTQSNNFFSSNNTTSQPESNFNHLSSSQHTFGASKNFSNSSSSESTTDHNIGHYFDSINTSNESKLNKPLSNFQLNSQQPNVAPQDSTHNISSFLPTDKSNNALKFPNVQNTDTNVSSHLPIQTKENFEATESLYLNSNKDVVTPCSLPSTESVGFNSNISNEKSLKSSEISPDAIPSKEFSSMTIDDKQKMPNRPIVNQGQKSASYFSTDSLLDKEKNSIAFQNVTTNVHSTSNSTPELITGNDVSQLVINKQTVTLPSSSNQATSHQSSELSINNQTVFNIKTSIHPATNQFSPPQQLNTNKILSNVSPESLISNALSTSDFTPTLQTIPIVPVSQPFHQSTSNVITPVSSGASQLPPQMFNNQSKSDAAQAFQPTLGSNSTRQFNNQQIPTAVPPVTLSSNQLPPQMFSYKPNFPTAPPSEAVSSFSSIQPIDNQPTTVTPITSTVNQFPPQMFTNNTNSKSMSPLGNEANQHPSKTFNNQSTPKTVGPNPSNIDQFPAQTNSLVQPEMTTPLQSTSGFPVNSVYSHSTQNTVPFASSVANQLPPQYLGNLPKSDSIPPLQATASFNSPQPFKNQPTTNLVSPVPAAANQLPPQMFNNQPKADIPHLQTTSSPYPTKPFNNQLNSSMVPPVLPSTNQLAPQILNNQPNSNVAPHVQPTSNQYPSQPFNNQLKSNMVSPFPSTVNQFPQQMLNKPGFDAYPSNKLTDSQYPPKHLSNQPIPASTVPSVQQTVKPYPPQPFYNQSKSNTFPSAQPVTNKHPSQPLGNQFGGQHVLSNQPPPSNQLYNQSNAVHPNQWPPRSGTKQSIQSLAMPPLNANQTNPMFPQQMSSNMSTLPPNVNQPTQRVGVQNMLPPNPPSTNNYYNQVQGTGNIQQSQLPPTFPGQNVQSVPRGGPQQSNVGFSNQTNYQQPNANYGQQEFHNQSQDPYRSEQNPSIVQQGFAKTWGYDNIDLLKSRDVLPGDGVQPPEIKLPQGYANCDNCSPDIFRCTLNKFPSSKNLLDKSRLPLGILIHPYKDLSCLTVIQCETITRCRNCRSYINPFVQFIDNAHWKCNLCYRVNELPGEFLIDPYTKTLGDPSRRPEILNSTIEYIASQDYMVRPPQPALYLFLLDVSRTATLTGYLEIVCDRILNKIMGDAIPGDSRTNIGFITYDSAVHFYQIANSDGGQPKQLIVSDTSEIFLPLPDGLMVNLEENKPAIKDLLTNLPNLYRESYNTGCALGAALQAAFKILAPRGGRVTVFQASLPNSGPGSLQPRDDGNAHTGDRVQHMTPSTDFYKKLALECSAEQIAVDMFFVSSQYLDITTISGISKYSAGCIHNFPQFDVKSPTNVTRFINCFDRYLSRKIGFEALLRLRCTRGVSIHSFHGNFFVRSSDLLMLPNVNPDNAYGMQLSIEDSLEGVSVVCFQAALLYTSSNAERRIRVHTLCIPVTDNLNDVFHNADQQAITCLIAKMAVDRSTEKSLSDAREAFFNAISDSLSAFKLGCSSYSGPGTMLSPVSLKVFPLYILATLKHAAFRTNQPTRLDERMFSMCQMKSLPLTNLIQYIYPDLYPIHSLEEQPKINYEKLTEIPLPPVIQLSAERVESNGVYLMDDSETLTIFVGHRCSDQLIQKLFGYVNANAMPELITTLTEVDSQPSYLLRSFISYLQHLKPYPLPIEIIKDNGPHKLRFYSRLIEDKFESSLSYYEFLQRLSQQVR